MSHVHEATSKDIDAAKAISVETHPVFTISIRPLVEENVIIILFTAPTIENIAIHPERHHLLMPTRMAHRSHRSCHRFAGIE